MTLRAEHVEKIRILYLLSEFMYGSKIRQVCDLAEGIHKELFEVEIGALETSDEARKEIERLGIAPRRIRVCPPRGLDRTRIGEFLRSPFQLGRGRYHIIHSLLYQSEFIEPLLVKTFTGAKYVYTKTNLQWENHAVNWTLKSKLADRIVSISGATRRLLEEKGFGKKVENIFLGIDTQLFSDRRTSALREKQGLPVDAVVFGCAAHFLEWKGHLLLIKAFEDLCRMDKRLYLILAGGSWGDEYYESVQRTIEESDVSGNIRVIGTVSDMPDFYSGIDCFVLPSRNEPFGYVYVEAMSCGKPVIACRAGGPLDIVEHGRSGFLVDINDRQALSERMMAYARDRSLGKQHGERARCVVLERFSKEGMIKEHEKLYLSLAGGGMV
jgi:glycosyltransferase involved in cell wall biosynthesis